jgi:hypothetical protein
VEHVRAVKETAQRLSRNEFYEVRYEQLATSPEATLQAVSDFLGLNWAPGAIGEALEANSPLQKQEGLTAIPVYGEVARRVGPVVKEPPGFIRKGKVGAWKTDLSAWEKFRVWSVAHRTMSVVGYTWKGAGRGVRHAPLRRFRGEDARAS